MYVLSKNISKIFPVKHICFFLLKKKTTKHLCILHRQVFAMVNMAKTVQNRYIVLIMLRRYIVFVVLFFMTVDRNI